MNLLVRCNGAYCVPDCVDCTTVAIGHAPWSVFWVTVRDLMLAGF